MSLIDFLYFNGDLLKSFSHIQSDDFPKNFNLFVGNQDDFNFPSISMFEMKQLV